MKKRVDPKVLFAVWELEPFLKVGGLGVVARSLPRALKSRGVDIRLVLPQYKAFKYHHQRKRKLGELRVKWGEESLTVTVSMITFLNAEIPVYLLGNKKYFDKPIPGTFAVFAGAVAELLTSPILGEWHPTIVHCNDNHCGLIPLLIKERGIPVKTLLTIHCVTHQRRSPVEYAEKLGIAKEKLSLMRWEAPARQLNFLLEGIKHADWVNTVSPTYLKEIQTEEYGVGLDDVIRKERKKISAILNGIDYDLRNPETNPDLAARYTADPKLSATAIDLTEPIGAKRANKALLQRRFGLPVKSEVTVIGFVGRLDARQKGIDVLNLMLWREKFEQCQFVIMGHGEEEWEERFRNLATFLPETVAVTTEYDDALASIIYAGSDFILIPSHFEPCCLIQMNAMRYGAIPIARATGGLNDTIANGRNGLLYLAPTARALYQAIQQALALKKRSTHQYQKMITAAMETDFSWSKSAKQYKALYKKLLA